MAVNRFGILNKKKAALIKVEKKEIARLLKEGKEEKARIKVEHVIRSDFTIEAYEILELLCELLHERIKLLLASQECPPDLDECVCTLIFCANRTECPELTEITKQLKLKYGKEFYERAEGNAGACVNDRVVHKLSVAPPTAFLIQNYLSRIADEFEVEWTPTELLSGMTPEGEQAFFDLNTSAMPAPKGFSVPVAPGSGIRDAYHSQQEQPQLRGDVNASLPPSSSSQTKTASTCKVGDLVEWAKADEEIPRGAVGSVLKPPTSDGRVHVRFPNGVFNLPLAGLLSSSPSASQPQHQEPSNNHSHNNSSGGGGGVGGGGGGGDAAEPPRTVREYHDTMHRGSGGGGGQLSPEDYREGYKAGFSAAATAAQQRQQQQQVGGGNNGYGDGGGSGGGGGGGGGGLTRGVLATEETMPVATVVARHSAASEEGPPPRLSSATQPLPNGTAAAAAAATGQPVPLVQASTCDVPCDVPYVACEEEEDLAGGNVYDGTGLPMAPPLPLKVDPVLEREQEEMRRRRQQQQQRQQQEEEQDVAPPPSLFNLPPLPGSVGNRVEEEEFAPLPPQVPPTAVAAASVAGGEEEDAVPTVSQALKSTTPEGMSLEEMQARLRGLGGGTTSPSEPPASSFSTAEVEGASEGTAAASPPALDYDSLLSRFDQLKD